MNGDALDGVHHNSVTQVSHNLKDQSAIAYTVLSEITNKAKDGYYHVRGTEAHVGKSAQEEERLAEALGAPPSFFPPPPAPPGPPPKESTAAQRELVEAFVEAGRWGDEPPQVVV